MTHLPVRQMLAALLFGLALPASALAASSPSWSPEPPEPGLADARDRSAHRQVELVERLQPLETLPSKLKTMLGATLSSTAVGMSDGAEASPSQTTETPQGNADSGHPDETAARASIVETDRTLVWALLAAGGLLGFWLIHRLTAPRNQNHASHPRAQHRGKNTLPPVLAHARPTAGGGATAAHPASKPIEASETGAPPDDVLPPPVSPRTADSIPVGDGIEDHESAVELAEIMESFGRVHGAAATLAEFIRTNPHQSITPWLKLMDLQQKSGQRAEFESLARELNRAFNVAVITWDNYRHIHALSDDSLERYPHIVKELTSNWRTAECQAYIDHLLRDNRHGTRDGFTLPVIEELLALAGVLDEQLGRYEPPAPGA